MQFTSGSERDQEDGTHEQDAGAIKGEEDGGLEFGPVSGFDQLCDAFHLVYQEYMECGYQEANEARMRYTVLQLLSTAQTFVATEGGTVVGTGTVILSSAAGLPSSDIFGDLFSDMENRGRLVAEGTMLACADTGRAPAHSLSLEILSCALAWSVARRVDDWCVVVNPKHLRFWNRTLGFEMVGESRVCEHVRDHPGILLRLPLREIRSDARCAATELKRRVLDRLPTAALVSRYQLKSEEVAVLLARRPEILERISPAQRAILAAEHPRALALAERAVFAREALAA